MCAACVSVYNLHISHKLLSSFEKENTFSYGTKFKIKFSKFFLYITYL